MRVKDKYAKILSGLLQGAEPEEIVKEAIGEFKPVATFVGYTGGFDSTVGAHWCMNNVPGCKVFLANTGIGVPAAWRHVRRVCAQNKWPLVEIHAREDCGQDYEEMVLKHGFPGPAHHYKMFQRLKERAVRKLLMDHKQKRSDNIMMLTGIRKDESERRSNYDYTVLDFAGNVLWVNPFYFKSASWFEEYTRTHGLVRSPVSQQLGMSGECLCGAYAYKGEKAAIRAVCPETAAYLDDLEARVHSAGHDWGWEDRPPKSKKADRGKHMPFCVGCEKTDNLEENAK